MKKKIEIIPPNQSDQLSKKSYQKIRVAAYCRVSTDSFDQENSFENQKEYYEKLISDNPEWTMAGIYADQGVTGTKTKKRYEFNRMITDCYEGKIDLVITKSVSRFARNTVDTLSYVRKLLALSIPVIFEKESLNTGNMDDEMQLTIMSMFAQAESESISKNVTWSIRKKYEKGEPTYGSIYGYKKVGNTIVPCKESVETINAIYQLYIDGLSAGAICNYLMECGVDPLSSDKWNKSVIISILKNERYVGDVLLQKSYTVNVIEHKRAWNTGQVTKYLVHNAHEPIVDRDIFDIVQKELAIRAGTEDDSVRRRSSSKKMNKYNGLPMSSFIRCGFCGQFYKRITQTRSRNKIMHYVKSWKCSGRHENHESCPNSPIIESLRMETALMDSINIILTDGTPESNMTSQEIVQYLGCDKPLYIALVNKNWTGFSKKQT